MKYLIYLVWTIYIIWWLIYAKIFLFNKDINENNNILNSIVIIIPEEKLISFNNNPWWIFEDENKNYWIWAWFIIDNSWTILTANHVVENDNIKYKILLNNSEYDSEIISRNKNTHIATLKIINNVNLDFHPLKIENNLDNISIWEKILSFWVDINNMIIVSNTWTIINKNSKLENKSNLLEISNNIVPGFSWWPILNSQWNVIWINYAIFNWKKYWISLSKN